MQVFFQELLKKSTHEINQPKTLQNSQQSKYDIPTHHNKFNVQIFDNTSFVIELLNSFEFQDSNFIQKH